MTGEKLCDPSVEFACGKLLFSLKNSKLHYLVRETPYSAYITIRKKLLASSKNEAFETVTNDASITVNVRDVEKENSRLKERNLDVEREHALLKIEFEELEIKFNKLKDIKSELDDKNEELFQENTNLQKYNATLSNDLKKEQAKAKVDFDLYKKEQSKRAKETTDLVDILEVTVENKNTGIKDLKEKLSKANADVNILKVAQQFSCQHCDFKTSTEVLLKEHIEVKHEPKYKFCEKQFQTSESLEKTHMQIEH